jgi:hypothetical protein
VRLLGELASASSVSRQLGIPRSTVREWAARHRRGLGPPGSEWRGGCERCGAHHDFNALPGEEYAYLLAVYLGDGCISRTRRGVFRLRLSLDGKYEEIIDRSAQAIAAVLPGRTVGQRWKEGIGEGCVEVYAYSKQWPCLFPQHGAGKKHDRRIQLVPWQEPIVERHRKPFVRGFIDSDGCRIIATDRGRASVRYHFSNLSDDIKRLYCESLDALGIAWTRPCAKQIAVYRKASAALLDEFVGPKR